LLSIMQQ